MKKRLTAGLILVAALVAFAPLSAQERVVERTWLSTDKDVYLADFFVNLTYESLYRHLVRDIADVTMYVLNACFTVIIKSSLESSIIDVIENDILSSRCNESFRNIESYSVRPACDPGILTFQRK